MDNDIYSLLMNPDEADAGAKAQAMSQALRKQQALGVLAQLTGDKVLGGVGQGMLQQAEKSQDRLSGAGESRLKLTMMARQAKAKADADKAQGASKMAMDLRNDLMGQQVYKDTQGVASAYSKLRAAGDTAAGDVSMIFQYMKLLDPSSSVKEGEVAMAEQARGVPAQILGLYNRAINGERLDPGTRRDFSTQAGNLYGAQIGRYNQLADQFKGLAQRQGISPEDVVLDFGFNVGPAPQAAPPKISSKEDFDRLPPGAEFIAPDGQTRRKPGGK